MTKKEDADFYREYNELRLRYAFQNVEIRKMFDEWIEKEKELDEIETGKSAVKQRSRKYLLDLISETYELRDSLVKKLNQIGIIFYTPWDIYSEYCRILKREKSDHLTKTRYSYLAAVVLKVEGREFTATNLKNDPILTEVFREGHFVKHKEWLMKGFPGLRRLERYDYTQELNFAELDWLLEGGDKDEPWVLNRKSRKAYILSEGGMNSDEKPFYIEGPIVTEKDLLKDGRYLNLKIDLSKRIDHIEWELKSIVGHFKELYDETDSSKSQTRKRRQSIALYKRYLRVYHLVQEKGEKWTEIAREVFPKEDPESAYVKAYSAHKEAKRLIAEGLP